MTKYKRWVNLTEEAGKRLKDFRERRGLSIEEVSESTGMCISYVAHTEGAHKTQYEHLMKLEALYGVAIEKIIGTDHLEEYFYGCISRRSDDLRMLWARKYPLFPRTNDGVQRTYFPTLAELKEMDLSIPEPQSEPRQLQFDLKPTLEDVHQYIESRRTFTFSALIDSLREQGHTETLDYVRENAVYFKAYLDTKVWRISEAN